MEFNEKIKNQVEFGIKIYDLCDEYELSDKLTSSEMFVILSFKAHDLLHK
jgi:hypothetical protein